MKAVALMPSLIAPPDPGVAFPIANAVGVSDIPLAACCCFAVLTGRACSKIGPHSFLAPSSGMVFINSLHWPESNQVENQEMH